LFLILILSGCSSDTEDSGANRGELVLPVQVGKVVFKDVVDEIRTVGNIAAEKRVMINAEVAGQIHELPVKEGGRLVAGDLIAQTDPREYRLEMERLQADRISAQKEHEKAQLGVRPEEQQRLKAQVGADASSAELARKEEQRMKRLLAEGVIAQSLYDEAAERLQHANEMLRASQAALAAGNHARQEDIVQTRAELESVAKRLALAELKLEKTAIRAPFDGVVLSRRVEVGAYVKDGDPVVEMIGASALKAIVEMPQGYRQRLRELREVAFYVPELDRHFTLQRNLNRRVRVIPDANIFSGNIQVQVDLPLSDPSLFPGLTLEAHLRFAVRGGVKHVPSIALVIGEEGTVVYLVQNGRAHLVPVKAGLEHEGLVEVTDFTHQLKPDSRLILRGSGAVFPSAKVMPTPAPSAGPARPPADAPEKPQPSKAPAKPAAL